MSDPTPPFPMEDNEALQSAVIAFTDLFPTPTSDQTHVLAGLLGYEPDTFLPVMQKLLAPLLSADDDQVLDELDADDEGDPLDIFLLSFYILNPEPTEEQLNALAILVGLTLEELEERTYSVMNQLMETTPDDDADLNTLELDDNFVADEDQDDDDVLTDGDNDVIQLL
jgi:hypothetical protein